MTRTATTLKNEFIIREAANSDRPHRQTLVIMYGFYGASDRALQKYSAIYHSYGFDVLPIKSYLKHFAWPKYSVDLADQTLTYLHDNCLQYNTFLVHAFSMGAYNFTVCLSKMYDNPKLYSVIQNKISGIVYDSLAIGSLEGMVDGIAAGISENKMVQWAIPPTMSMYFYLTHKHTVTVYDHYLNIAEKSPLQVPTLLFCSKDDLLSKYDMIESWMHGWRQNYSFPIHGKVWDKSRHAAHLMVHEMEYLQHDSLLCHAAKLDEEEAYIVKYVPHATKKVAHHMMVYGCGEPGSNRTYWECASMDDISDRSVCGDGERQIVWAWAMDADGRSFPEGVGFRVGGNTGIRYLVIQLHYADKFPEGQTDNSGVTLHLTKTRKPYQAGYYVLCAVGYIPPMVNEFHIETACMFDKNYTIYPVAYRTHSHTLGVVTSGYRVRGGKWTEIGRMSPQLPQTFYNVTTSGIRISQGDILAARCTMSSQRQASTKIGAEHSDEMCNFYIMYYTDFLGNLRIQYCIRNAQEFQWSTYLSKPPETASSIDGLPPFTRVDPYADEPVEKKAIE